MRNLVIAGAILVALLSTACGPRGGDGSSPRAGSRRHINVRIPLPQFEPPPPVLRDYRRNKPDKMGKADPVAVTPTGERYHRLDCFHLQRGVHRLSRADAQAEGYTRCKDCLP